MPAGAPTAVKPKLGALLLKKRSVTREQVLHCLELQKKLKPRQRLGSILIKKGYVKHHDVKAALVEQTRVAPPAPVPVAPASRKHLWWLAVCALPVVALGAYFLLGEETPEPPKPAPTTPSPAKAAAESPKPAAPPPAPERPKSMLESCLAEVAALEQEGKIGDAIHKLDEFPVKLAKESDAEERIARAREALLAKSKGVQKTTVQEAVALASAGRLQEAADRLQELVKAGTNEQVADAYQRVREAAATAIRSTREQSVVQVTAEVDKRRSAYAAVPPARDPQAAHARALASLSAEKWEEAIQDLTALAADPKWRAQALTLRCVAHFSAQDFYGVLLDAELLLEAGVIRDEVLSIVEKSLSRAPIDEAVLRLYDRAVEKHAHPILWFTMAQVYTWRHDAARAAEVMDRAEKKKVSFPLQLRDAMGLYRKLKERGFPHGKPVYVDYVGPYEVLTDAGPARAREIAKQLEGIARDYEKVLPYSKNPNLRFRVMAFAKQFDYNYYHADLFGKTAHERGAAAYYWGPIKQLVVCIEDDEFLKVLRHEAFHQYLDYVVDNCPRWFNEGSASFFEESTAEGPQFNKRWHDAVVRGLEKLPSIREMMTMPVEKWVGDPREYFFYGQAWSFIYYIHMQGRGSLWQEYLRQLVLGRPGEVAFAQSFGKADLDALERGWKAAVVSGNYE